MDSDQIVKLVLVLVVVVLPALTVTAALAARFAVKPIVEAIIRLKELAGSPAVTPQLEARMGAVESEMHELRTLVERVVAAVEFDAQVRAGNGADTPRLPQAQERHG